MLTERSVEKPTTTTTLARHNSYVSFTQHKLGAYDDDGTDDETTASSTTRLMQNYASQWDASQTANIITFAVTVVLVTCIPFAAYRYVACCVSPVTTCASKMVHSSPCTFFAVGSLNVYIHSLSLFLSQKQCSRASTVLWLQLRVSV